MVVELSAVRVLAPRFGDSVPVWTNVIGVILLALAVGAFVGGRVADRGGARLLTPLLLFAATGITAATPWLVPRIGDWILPADLTLDRALPVLVSGSLGTTLCVFAPPVLCLGAVSPMLIQQVALRQGAQVGSVVGTLYAAGTIGSLLGTFAATHLLVPGLGLRGTFGVAAACLLAAALLATLLARQIARTPVSKLALGLAGPPIGTLGPGQPDPHWLGDGKLVELVDAAYQRLWVVERDEPYKGGQRKARVLAINEGLDSFHSVRIEGVSGTGGRYYDAFGLLAACLVQEGEQERRVLSLGCAAGSIVRVLDALMPKTTSFVGVDIDPAVLELGRRYFDMPEDGARHRFVGGLDARVYVDRVDRGAPSFDLVCVDTYRNQIYLPLHVTSVEFFEALEGRLTRDGLVALNVGDVPGGGPVLEAVAGTLATVFDVCESYAVPRSRNFMVVAYNGAALRVPRSLRQATRPDSCPESFWTRAVDDLAWKRHAPADPTQLLTDDRSTLEGLHERIYARLPASGTRRP